MKKELLKFLVLLAVAIGAGPAASQVWRWSVTASANSNADPSINWRVGMAPSAVSPSARAMMAGIAEWNLDISGAAPTGGSPSAITFTTASGFTSLSAIANQHITFINSTPNAAGATLNVDGTGAAPILTANGTPIVASFFTVGGVYTVTYYAVDSSYHVWNVFGNPYNVPLGALIPYTLSTVPNANFVFPAGQCLSTTTYATYWVALGSPASGTCAGGQFRIVDMSGRVPAGLDTMPGFVAANRLTASTTGCGTAMTSVGASCANGLEYSQLTLAQLPTGITAATAGVITVTANTSNKNFPTSGGTFSGIQTLGGSQQSTPSSTSGGIGDWQTASSMSTAGTVSVTSNNTSGTAQPNVPPIIGVTFLLRVI